MITALVDELAREAESVDERRLLVLAGDRPAGVAAASAALDAGRYDPGRCVLVGEPADLGVERVPVDRSGDLLGTTHDAVVYDAHDRLDPNVIGRTVGTVDGGGLYVLLTPPLDAWPARRDRFDETLAVPPFTVDDVGGHFRRRLVETLRSHPGIAIVEVDHGRVVRDGLTEPPPRPRASSVSVPAEAGFPEAIYEACMTADQARAVEAFESLREPGTAVVVEADRGRGKSSAAGLAAAGLANQGRRVILTAPSYRSATAALDRAEDVIATLDVEAGPHPDDAPGFVTGRGGSLRFVRPGDALEADPDVLLVDEAAAIPVARLSEFLAVGSVGFTTTIHGYEGAGRGFSIRFRASLDASDLTVTDVTMSAPVRYAAGDPIEVWSFRALLLDASPAVDPLVTDATPESVKYRPLEPPALLADESRLREAFGLLVLAHYRTEPADLARLLDAPNVSVRALLHDGHVAAVALLAREGGLSAERRSRMYEGERVRGNMLPDVLTSQLRDEEAGAPVGLRVMRIATHAAVRSRGLGSHLLERIEVESSDSVDWLGTGFGATPRLLRFWDRNDYSAVHLSTRRNAASGEHSAIMMAPTSEAGRALLERHSRRFVRRIADSLADALSSVDPDVVRGTLRTVDAEVPVGLDDDQWRHVAAAAYGPGQLDVDPGPAKRLVLRQLIDPDDADLLTDREERLLIRKLLQAHGWGAIVEAMAFPSRRMAMRAAGDALAPLVDAYGADPAFEERDRYQ